MQNILKKIRKNKIISAFSVMEIMIAILIVSILLGALAPVISKKLSNHSIYVGKVNTKYNSSTSDQCAAFSDYCSLCDNQRCIKCSNTCPTGQFSDSSHCICKQCSEMFDPNCSTCNESSCTGCANSYSLSDDSEKCCPTLEGCISYDNNCACVSYCSNGKIKSEDGSNCCSEIPNCKNYNSMCTCEQCNDNYGLNQDRTECIEGIIN